MGQDQAGDYSQLGGTLSGTGQWADQMAYNKKMQILQENKQDAEIEKIEAEAESKEHSLNLSMYQKYGEKSKTYQRYIGNLKEKTTFLCPKKLQYQFLPNFNIHISDKCCINMKEKPLDERSLS